MSAPPLYVREVGEGPPMMLVHGSATTGDGWVHQVRGLKGQFRLHIVDRRGAERSPLPPGVTEWSVAQHAEDLAEVIESRSLGPTLLCGSSFGAVTVLQLARTRPELVRGMVLCEPPLPPQDDLPAVVRAFMDDFDRTLAEEGGPAAARLFLRIVLGPADFDGLPDAWRVRSEGLWDQIRLDVHALADYRPDFESLRNVRVPALMLGGDRSEGYFIFTLEKLRMVLPESARLTLKEAGHMMHLDAPEAFNRAVVAFANHFIGGG